MTIHLEELQNGYTNCSMCKHMEAGVHSREAEDKTWRHTATPAHLRIICVGCKHVTLVKPGTINLKGPYIGARTWKGG